MRVRVADSVCQEIGRHNWSPSFDGDVKYDKNIATQVHLNSCTNFVTADHKRISITVTQLPVEQMLYRKIDKYRHS